MHATFLTKRLILQTKSSDFERTPLTRMIIQAKSESDVTSSAQSSPRRQLYYVQSPSRDSRDGDRSSTMHASPVYNTTPQDSPSHYTYSRHSSASRFSGTFRSSNYSGRRIFGRKRSSEKGWPECKMIDEEGYNYGNANENLSRTCQVFFGLLGFLGIFTVFCFIIWIASRHYKAQYSVQSLTVHNMYYGEGSDGTGVPTKILTTNCSIRIAVRNPASFFGIHVSSPLVSLKYSEITVAKGQLKKYYQPRRSSQIVLVVLQGTRIPLYGAGASFAVSDGSKAIPMTLDFEVRSKGNVVGKLVKTRHQMRISCSLVIESKNNKPIKFKDKSDKLCTYTGF